MIAYASLDSEVDDATFVLVVIAVILRVSHVHVIKQDPWISIHAKKKNVFAKQMWKEYIVIGAKYKNPFIAYPFIVK